MELGRLLDSKVYFSPYLVFQTTSAIREGDIARIVRQAQRDTERAVYEEIAKMRSTRQPCTPNARPYVSSAAADPAGCDSFDTSRPDRIGSPTRAQETASHSSNLLKAVKTKLGEHGREFERLEPDVNRYDRGRWCRTTPAALMSDALYSWSSLHQFMTQ